MKIILTEEQKQLLSCGNITYISELESTFYYLPFWFKKDSENNWEQVKFDNLPQYIKDKVNEENKN